jgi:site-specific DNA recombinase
VKRVIGYLRVSTRGQAEKGMGLAAQRQRVRDYAGEQGLELVEIVEEAASGAVKEGALFSHKHRPILSRLIERAGQGEYDVLLVASFDRLSRDYMSLLFLKRLLKTYGVETVSTLEENGNGDAVGELIERVIAAIHEFERRRLLERIKAGKEQKRATGGSIGGPAPYGYVSTAEGMTPNRADAPVVRRIFEETRDGYTPGRIAKGLNADAIESPSGRAWNRQTVRNIIENAVYAGQRFGVKAAHPAIVSRRLFNAANETLRARARSRKT